MSEPSWSTQYAARRRVAARFPTVWHLPLVSKLARVFAAHVPASARVLDVGAGGRAAAALLPGRTYLSLDPDPAGAHDHRRLEDVSGPLDAILLLEVVEHLTPPAAEDLLRDLAARLEPGGVLVVSTPNTHHPPAYLRDATHVTPWAYDELGGLVERCGLELRLVARVYNDAFLRKIARRYLFGWLFRLLGLDFARQIVVVAARPR